MGDDSALCLPSRDNLAGWWDAATGRVELAECSAVPLYVKRNVATRNVLGRKGLYLNRANLRRHQQIITDHQTESVPSRVQRQPIIVMLTQVIVTPVITYTQPLGLFIDGQWVEGVQRKRFETVNPTNEQPIVAVHEAGPEG